MNYVMINSKKDIFPIEANGTIKNKKIKEIIKNFEKNETKYIFPIEANRINKLFRILIDKEKDYVTVLDKLELPSFQKIKNNEKIKNFKYNYYSKVINNNVVASDKFLNYLNNLSDIYSFNPRKNVLRLKILDDVRLLISILFKIIINYSFFSWKEKWQTGNVWMFECFEEKSNS